MSILFALVIFTAVKAEKIVYELWPEVNDIATDRTPIENTIVSKPYHCARLCHVNQKCAIFSFNVIAGSCGLYEDIMFKNDLKISLSGQRYYFMRKASCPRREGFLVSPASGPFIWYMKMMVTTPSAEARCASVCGRLAVLPTEDKLAAVRDTVLAIGWIVIVGGSDKETEGEFRWSDGTLVSENMFFANEPNQGVAENCLAIYQGKLADIGCNSVQEGFICEIVY